MRCFQFNSGVQCDMTPQESRAIADTHSSDEAGPDLRSLGVQGNAHRPVVDAAGFEALASFAHILDGLCVVLQKDMAMGMSPIMS